MHNNRDERLHEHFNQHHDSDQSFQPYSLDLSCPSHNRTTIHATCSGQKAQAMKQSESGQRTDPSVRLATLDLGLAQRRTPDLLVGG